MLEVLISLSAESSTPQFGEAEAPDQDRLGKRWSQMVPRDLGKANATSNMR